MKIKIGIIVISHIFYDINIYKLKNIIFRLLHIQTQKKYLNKRFKVKKFIFKKSL